MKAKSTIYDNSITRAAHLFYLLSYLDVFHSFQAINKLVTTEFSLKGMNRCNTQRNPKSPTITTNILIEKIPYYIYIGPFIVLFHWFHVATKQVTIALAWRNWEKELLFSAFQIRGEKFISSRWHTMKGSSLNFCSVFFLLYMILMLFYFHWSFHLWIMIFCWCFPTSNWKYFLLEFRVWDFFKKFKLKNIEDKRTLLTRYIHICLDQSYF